MIMTLAIVGYWKVVPPNLSVLIIFILFDNDQNITLKTTHAFGRLGLCNIYKARLHTTEWKYPKNRHCECTFCGCKTAKNYTPSLHRHKA
jgi:hypothetical protein